ncbi:PREDICTED: hyoscyamine 6-dioxygenase-like [Populus euphratica]|uniref:Hyoscyamine 6-dioxygenase-like n=1 Tax=Populus euphratica TaxID=75702 RepID=A0AAJ6V4X8_POPEU|nr:PREDICTED: hyoscyamine 6-dioxygenase-like [Populus euphratica]
MAPTAKLLLADLASSGVKQIPSNYIRPISDRPNLSDVQISDGSIPLIDLHGLNGPNHSTIIEQIGQACQRDGFFQVKNHGIPEEMISIILNIATQFFKLPESERLKNYSDDPTKTTRLSTSFNIKTEQVSSWRDFLRLHCYPLEDYIHEWPSNPPSFRKDVAEYCTSVRGLVLRLLEAISESLGLERDYIDKKLGGHGQHMAMNYYVLSNDRYKSVLHRAVVNSDKERISIPTFYCPSPDAVIGPPKELVDDEHPAVYRDFTYGEYYEKFWNKGLLEECCLDLFKPSNNTT